MYNKYTRIFASRNNTIMSEDFVWTDELVKEYLRLITSVEGNDYWQSEINKFKQSKQKRNKDWEIVESRYISEDSEKTILSVRRRSDNEVFSVGDGCSGFGYEEISHFTIAGKEMIASFKSGIFSNIDFLFKKAKQKLFTTSEKSEIIDQLNKLKSLIENNGER